MYPPVAKGVVQALRDIFEGGFPADKVIQRQMKSNKKWGSSDRRMFAESVYDIVRWWRRLLFACGLEYPPAGNVYSQVLAAWCEIQKVPGTFQQNDASAVELVARWKDSGARAVRESLPNWLDQWGSEQLGGKWDEILPILNSQAPVYLRCNRLKTTPEKLKSRLAAEQFDCAIVEGDCLRLKIRGNVFISKAFKEGLFEMQDLNSQRVGLALAPQPGERVIDGCAGAGGKGLHIAALMGNKGKVIALDVSEKKLANFRERSSRDGASCIELKLIDSTKVIKRLHNSADRVLLDVPCTGTGVWRRNPDSKWRLTADEIARVAGLQTDILSSYSLMCKAGGRLVYSTCSIMPSENEQQIDKFLATRADEWKLISQETLWPERDGPDGFFIAVLQRAGVPQ